MFRELTAALEAEGCEALLVLAESSRDPDLAPFVGAVHLGSAFLVAPRQGEPRLGYLTPMEREEASATGLSLLAPEELGVAELRGQGCSEPELWTEILQRGLAASGLEPGRVALAGRAPVGRAVAACAGLTVKGWSFVDGRRASLLGRRIKRGAAERAVRHAAAGTRAAFRRVAELLAASRPVGDTLEVEGRPLTVGRLRREVARVLAEHGLEQPEGNILAPGAAGGVPHSVGADDAWIAPHQTLVVDLFPRQTLFADCTRTFCVGAPPEPVAAAHAAVRAALELAHDRLAAGVRYWDLQVAVCRQLEAAGHPTPLSDPGTLEGYAHGLGHGVGYEVHEFPSFRREAGPEGVAAVGDLVTLEPGLYYPDDPLGGFGIRLEDLVLVGEGDTENLTPLPYEMDPTVW